MAATSTGAMPLNRIRRRGRALTGGTGLPDGDLDAAVARLGHVVAGLDEQVSFTVRDDVHGRRRKSRAGQNAAYRGGPFETEGHVRFGVAHRVGVADDDDLGNLQRL